MNKEDCPGCMKIEVCFAPCKYISVLHQLGGKLKPLKERLAPPDISKMNNPGDYKSALQTVREWFSSKQGDYIIRRDRY